MAKTSAGAIHYTPVAKVTNLARTMEELKEKGMWFVCADMDGEVMYDQNLTGSIGLVIGNEGTGVSRLVKEHCDFTASIPMKGDIDSLNASVAAGVLAFEIVRQRMKNRTYEQKKKNAPIVVSFGGSARETMMPWRNFWKSTGDWFAQKPENFSGRR